MKRRLTVLEALCILTPILFSTPYPTACAQEIVVTATALEDTSSSSVAGRSPTAFTEILEVSPLATGLIETRDAIRKAVSIDLPTYGGAEPSPVGLRGANYQQTLVMLDGVPITPVTGDITDLSLYAIPEIDRIEIIKGSNSAAYGGSAMGGVVNIVTRNPVPGDAVELTSSLGTYGYSLYNLFMNTERGGTGFMLDVTRSRAENDFLYEQDDGVTARRENNDTENTFLLSKLWMDLSGWDTLISGALARKERGSPGSEGSAGWLTPDDEVDVSQFSLTVDSVREFDADRSLAVKASRILNRTHTFAFSSDVWNRLASDYLDLVYEQDLGRLSLAPGITVRRERLDSDDYGIHSRTVTSGVLNAALDTDPILLSLTARHDYSTAFEGRWTWHTGALYRVFPHVGVRANAGTGYREPTMGQLYAPSSGWTFVSNPDLEPEQSFGWDLGTVVEYERIGFGASYFASRYSDLIRMDYPAETTFTYVNVESAHASGVEANAWIRPVEEVKLSAGYALHQFRYGSGSFESKRIRNKPQDIFTLQADYLPVLYGRQVDVFVSYQFREGAYQDDANTEKTGNRNILDAGVAFEITGFATAAFKVNNLFDDTSVEYEDRSQWGTFWYPVPGRTYRASLQLSF